jgi:hypothetical protein
MTNTDKKRFITIEEYYVTRVLELIKFYGECSDTDCKTCELGEVCKKTVELEDGIKELEVKWEKNNEK